MNNSMHDLSAGLVELDYRALERTAGIAYRECRERIERLLSALQNLDIYGAKQFGECTERRSLCDALKESAISLAIAGETYAVLKEGKTRETVSIVFHEFENKEVQK